MRWRKLSALVALLSASIGFTVAPATHAVTPLPAAERDMFVESTPDTPLRVTIQDLTPRIFTTEDALKVQLAISNVGPNPITNPTVTLHIQNQTPNTLDNLSQYFAGDRYAGQLLLEHHVSSTLASGQTQTLDLIIPRSELPFDGDYAWGPRGITATITDNTHSADDHSVVIWDSGIAIEPDSANVILPWTQKTHPSFTSEKDVTADIADIPGITLAVDPTSLHTPTSTPADADNPQSAAQPTTDNTQSQPTQTKPTDTAQSADHTRKGALDQLLTTTHIPFFTLLPHDADPALVAAISHEDIPAQTSNLDAHHTAQLPPIIWATSRNFTTDLLRTYPQATVIAPPGTLAPSDDLDFTPATLVAIERSTGQTDTVGYSNDTSLALSSSDSLTHLFSWEAQTPADKLDRDQLLIAASALFYLERPDQQRSIISTLPRDQVLTKDSLNRIRTFFSPRWVLPTTLATLITDTPTDVDRTPVPSVKLDPHDQQAVERIRTAASLISPLKSVVTDPDAIKNDVRNRVYSALSASSSSESHAQASLNVENYARTLSTGIKAEPSVTINLINKTAQFPVRVSNTLVWDATVQVTLQPSDPRLRVVEPTTVTIPAQTTSTVEVPVHAIGAGDIEVSYIIRNLQGDVLDSSQSVEVRLRAGWEDAITFGFAIFIALLFTLSLARTIRRRLSTREVPGTGGTILAGMIPVSDHPIEPKKDKDLTDDVSNS